MLRFIFLAIFISSFSVVALKNKITLLDHQRYVVDFLVKNPKIRGLLIDHSLGSGKTFLALAFCETEPKTPVVIVLPSFLKANWEIQMEKFGVSNSSRYLMVSLEEAPDFLAKMDLTKSIVIIDEIHQLVAKIRQFGAGGDLKFAQLYLKLREGKRILGLTGTPIFTKSSDIAYILNMVSASDLLALSDHEFRQNYTKVMGARSWLRGYFLESKWTDMLAPPILIGLVSLLTLPASTTAALLIASVTAVPIARRSMPLEGDRLREFDAEKISKDSRQFVSYYETNMIEDSNFPRREFYARETTYNEGQVRLFFRFANNSLNASELQEVYSGQLPHVSADAINVVNSNIQWRLSTISGAGRQIGNLAVDGQPSAKLIEVVSVIDKSQGPVVIYSNYYETGILAFASHLEKTKYKGQYQIFTPNMEVKQQVKMLNDYNKGKIKILMLHPDITEGVSLNGTDQLHLLEPILTNAMEEQIIGRVIRFKSHISLPKERQRVQIYSWAAGLYYSPFYMPFPYRDDILHREHMLEYFPEVNENRLSRGIVEVDKNYTRKDTSPDDLVLENRNIIQREMEAMKKVFREHSIEKSI